MALYIPSDDRTTRYRRPGDAIAAVPLAGEEEGKGEDVEGEEVVKRGLTAVLQTR